MKCTNLHRGFSGLQFTEADLKFSFHVHTSVANVHIRLRDGVALNGNSSTRFLLVFIRFYRFRMFNTNTHTGVVVCSMKTKCNVIRETFYSLN